MQVICLHNVTDKYQKIQIDTDGLNFKRSKSAVDVLTGEIYAIETSIFSLELSPYQVLWLKA